MNIREFSFNLQELYAEMSATFSDYQKSSGLNCLASCGRCCTNPDIEASVLEMIPFALKVHDEGTMESWLHEFETNSQDSCLLLKTSDQGATAKCVSYNERPSICRMFGVGGILNKYQEKTLSLCKFIREEHPEPGFETIQKAPVIADWSHKMGALDPELLKNKRPINEAMHEALKKVAFYAQYQDL